MKYLLSLSLLLISVVAISQNTLNFDFEAMDADKPRGWSSFGDGSYVMGIDSVNAYQGKNSGTISYDGDAPDYSAWSYALPANYSGKRVKLTGYVKTENVTEGWAGLWLRIDPDLAFDNMQDRGPTGTTDWTKYEIELDFNADEAQQIVFGGALVGKGKMWLDDLQITIDNVAVAKAKPKPLLPAEKDSAFYAGSNITFPALDNRLLHDMAVLGKVWGFLKYHHPVIGKGDYNWDFELFRFLPDYLTNKNAAERDQMLLDWITKFGEVPVCTSCVDQVEDAFLQPDFSWLEKGEMAATLKEKLRYIRKNRHQGKHFYIGMAPGIGNPDFRHENPYKDMPYPDAGFRLLALYRYWNAIQYFFPYKHLIDKDWNEVLAAYLPLFINAKDELAYELATVRIIGEIADTHANLWRGANAIYAWKGEYFPPIHVRFIEDQLVVMDYYNPELKEKVGLEKGDIITRINGKPVGDIVKERNKYYPASNQPTRLRDMSAELLRSNEKEIQLHYKRNGKEESKALSLYEKDSLNIYRWYRLDDEKCFKMLDHNIGYVTLKSIRGEDIPVIKETFKDTEGIVIDIRNYPSMFVVFSLGGYFLPDTTAFVKFTGGDVDNPGTFTFTENLQIPNQETTYKGKVVVLINEFTQSQAEYTTMAFRAAPNTTVIGSTTAGADGNISAILLPGGLQTIISGIGVYYPDGTETQRVGIVPDIEVKPTINGIKQGRDELIEKAVEVILEKD